MLYKDLITFRIIFYKTLSTILSLRGTLLLFIKVLRKSKLSESPTRRYSFYKNAFTTTKNKSYFIKLVNKTIK